MNIKAQEYLATMTEEEIASVYRAKFSDWTGQLVLEHLKMGCNCYQPSFDEQAIGNREKTFFNEGKRSVVLSIETFVNMQPQKPKPAEGE